MESSFTHGKILPLGIEDEMKKSYIDYAMSVIVGRALPDVRDGLKPVHRRILYSMYERGVTPDKPHKKSARIVGDVLGKYHPHGDTAVYDSVVRMAQDFSIRYPLIDGHGNFGSIDGDSAAAMRYTEVRLSKFAMEMMSDINKETVDFSPNYDGTEEEPVVLPSRVPNLLVNGSSGIAVGMATNIPPHNLGEVIDGVIKLIEDPEVDISHLMTIIKGPDFPTGALIMGRDGIREAYATGRGSVKMRARANIEQMNNGKQRIIVTEIPYQVNKARLIEKIAELVRDKKVDGIVDLRDESDRTGMRIVIELRRDVNARVILNQLYKHTQLQDTFGVITLALVDGQPRILNLKQVLNHYLEHQKDVIVRRTRFDLAKAEARAHIVEGLKIALDHIDAVISTIRESKNTEIARERLMERFGLSDKQAQAILEMRFRALTGLERQKLDDEYRDLIKTIAYLTDVLKNEKLVLHIIKQELLAMRDKYGDPRRTQIVKDDSDFNEEDLIAEEDMVITITNNGYIKRLNTNTYRSQKRGGRGITAMATKEEDFVEHLFITTTHHYLMFFTNKGKTYRLKVHEIPEAGRTAKGTALVNLLYISGEETVNTVIPVKEYSEDLFLFMATRKGIVKKSVLSEYDSSRKDGIIAISLDENDELIGVKLTGGAEEIILGTRNGKAIRFSEEEVRGMGRTARGVKGINLDEEDWVVSMDSVTEGGELMVISENGFGKRTLLDEYGRQSRGGKGLLTMKVIPKIGQMVAIKVVKPGDELMIITKEGIIIRINVEDTSVMGRNTQGVTLMRLQPNDHVVAVAKVVSKDDEV
ncbi:DNA gyrase subunit A [Candidatus Formimonas warabiya]|uniref:DNA gyrase subunit A n=1 Tax=Formimonas warabiya TaxID=1761012 RepID=A0A3G1KVE3_FORW1|nr:DNA gyrase subunit A [Candidatus Formimonas warabiya]ATW26411.1 DNA gyrase subunit A [Candidatus Formimonas warabiya]